MKCKDCPDYDDLDGFCMFTKTVVSPEDRCYCDDDFEDEEEDEEETEGE
jgi:hypothetical protein